MGLLHIVVWCAMGEPATAYVVVCGVWTRYSLWCGVRCVSLLQPVAWCAVCGPATVCGMVCYLFSIQDGVDVVDQQASRPLKAACLAALLGPDLARHDAALMQPAQQAVPQLAWRRGQGRGRI